MSDSSDDNLWNGNDPMAELYDVDMVRFDVHIDGPPEGDDRARFFQDIARKFRDLVRTNRESTIKDQNRIRALKNRLFEFVSCIEELRQECNRHIAQISYLEGYNEELAERVSGVSSSYVQACLDHDSKGHQVTKWKIAAIGLIGLCCLLMSVVTYLVLCK